MMPRGIQWYMERSFKLTEFTPGISHSTLTVDAMVFLSVCGIFVFTDLSVIDMPCYVGINSSGKKACAFLLSSFGLMSGLSYMRFFGSCSLWSVPTLSMD